ncbi:glycoside hydrolase [Rhizopogon salebrosus TDB-379]|nr:glycoside hydrolase [Rhizopogon salebrosus TDB-379]
MNIIFVKSLLTGILRTLEAINWVNYPELAMNGTYSAEEVYTDSDTQYIVQYVGAEIDTPGHTPIIGASYPVHVACFGATPWLQYTNEPPADQLRFALPEVMNFIASFSSMLQRLGLSTGMMLNDALNAFTQTTHGALIAEGKTPVIWGEMVFDWNIILSNETIVMVWISSEDALAVAEKGKVSWCDPFKSWSEAYTFDPLANLTEVQYKLVPGEIFWSGKRPTGPLNTTEVLPCLQVMDDSGRALQNGTTWAQSHPKWCALRPDACDLYA